MQRFLSAATRSPSVALIKFNKLRSRQKGGLVFAYEGFEDPIFYAMAAQRCGFKEQFHPLVLNGKDMVLGLRKLLQESIEADKGEGVAFFVDADFDGLKGHPAGSDIYVTPTYSIENIVCSVASLKSLLNLEFKLYEDELEGDINTICNHYANTLNSFITEMRDVNLLIYFGRTSSYQLIGAKILEISNQIEKYFKLEADTLLVSSFCRGNSAKSFIKFDCDFDFTEVNKIALDFDKLVPAMQWRGKFIFFLFVKFINFLVEDRNSVKPKFFSKGKGKVKLNLTNDSVYRILTTACELPPCINNFLNSLPAASLR